jgi:hypothetical protein
MCRPALRRDVRATTREMVESAPARSGMLPSSNDVPVVPGAIWAGPLELSALCRAPKRSATPRGEKRAADLMGAASEGKDTKPEKKPRVMQ